MIPEPALYSLASGFRGDAVLKEGVGPVAVEGGAIPFVVALHPAIVAVFAVLATVIFGEGLAAVVCLRGIAHVLYQIGLKGALSAMGK